jgi:hypothetical protein
MSSTTTVSEVKVSPAPAAITLAGKVAIVTGASRYVHLHIHIDPIIHIPLSPLHIRYV